MKSGVRFYEWRGKMVARQDRHHRSRLVDSWIIESRLLEHRMQRRNQCDHPKRFGWGQMEGMFAGDLQNSQQIDPEQWGSRPIWERLEEVLAEPD